jgi:hypothetical protein
MCTKASFLRRTEILHIVRIRSRNRPFRVCVTAPPGLRTTGPTGDKNEQEFTAEVFHSAVHMRGKADMH